MIRTAQSSLMAGQVPAKDLIEIGLRSTAAMAQVACDAGDRLGKLQIGALRTAFNGCTQATKQFLSAEPLGEADPTTEAMQRTMSYWRSLAGLVAMTQAEVAELMDSGLQEMAELAEATSGKGSPAGAANLPLAIYAAAGASMLATTQAMCGRIGDTARQFAANSGIEREVVAATGGEEQEAGHVRARAQRKAA